MTVSRQTRWLICGFECLAAIILQSLPCPVLEIFGSRSVLAVAGALSIAAFESEVPSIIFAALCGVLSDISCSGMIGLYSVVLTVACYCMSLLFENFFKRRLFTVAAVSFAAIVIVLTMQFIVFHLMRGYSDGWHIFTNHYIPRMFCTLLAVPVFYGLEYILFSHAGAG